jgi:hypothetical protein
LSVVADSGKGRTCDHQALSGALNARQALASFVRRGLQDPWPRRQEPLDPWRGPRASVRRRAASR